MKQRNVSISVTGPGRGEVILDGERVEGVRGITFGARVDEMALVVLDVLVPTAQIDGEMIVTVPERTAETLIALGWTPPAEQPYGGSDRPKAWRHMCGQLNEGEPVMCSGCRFDVEDRPQDVESRYVLVDLAEEVDGAAS
ncbi:hypothetical protein ACIG0D_01675 [Streptomyces sp. NPDC052773]|uniref:hypothetical protein n=1 Tax=Streptomyces sp. NPDC052773 TaxID=3365693 RepID=UPI0037D4E0B2